MGDDRFWDALIGDTRVRWGVEPDSPLLLNGRPVYVSVPYKLRAMEAGVFDPERADLAADDAERVVRDMLIAGIAAFCPVLQGHAVVSGLYRAASEWSHMADVSVFALDSAGWDQVNRLWLRASRDIYVPDIPGWRLSAGIQREVDDVLRRNGIVYLRAPAVELV